MKHASAFKSILFLVAVSGLFFVGVFFDKFKGDLDAFEAKAEAEIHTPVPQNDAEAAKLFKQAAEEGNARAQFKLGLAYWNGEGVVQNYAEAAKWLERAAEQGNAKAQFNLGQIYYGLREGAERDGAEGMKWYKKSAEQGNTDAQFALGTMYWSGEGAVQNYAEAYFWFNLAASRNRDFAQYRDSVAKQLTPEILAETQKRAVAWRPKVSD